MKKEKQGKNKLAIKNNKKTIKNKMKVAIIRIRGRIKVNKEIEKTLEMLRLRKKHVCVIVDDKKEIMGMIHKIKNFVAYGEITKETLKSLIEKRAEPVEKRKIDDKHVEELFSGKIKLQDLKIKPFFRLNPPKHGFRKSIKEMWPRGILGNQGKEINKLIVRML